MSVYVHMCVCMCVCMYVYYPCVHAYAPACSPDCPVKFAKLKSLTLPFSAVVTLKVEFKLTKLGFVNALLRLNYV